MSHFAVLVIGPDVETQLQPYHEFECTGTNDQFVQDVDITDEVRSHMVGDDPMTLEDALDWHGLADAIVSHESEVDKVGNDCEHKYGFAVVKDGDLVKAIDRTNPNKKWDWWVVGGRWSGFLKLKDGSEGELGRKGLMGYCADDGPGRADSAIKGAIDFAGMRDHAGDRAAALYDAATAAKEAAGYPADATWEGWDMIRAANAGDIEKSRESYHGQGVLKAVRQALKEKVGPFFDADELLVSRESYIQAARDSATVLYAVVKDGQWIAKGDMGWWGMSNDAVSQNEWNRKVNELLDGLPDDTRITVVDCHI